MKQLFATRSTPLTPLLPRCEPCGLYKSCNSPKLPLIGKGTRFVLVVLDSPDENEDRSGIPFSGPAANHLRQLFRQVSSDLDRDCWLTYGQICRPNEPTGKYAHYCAPNALGAIRRLKPTCTLLFGSVAVKSVLGALWGKSCGGVGRWEGWRIPSQELNSWILPTFHPNMLHYLKSAEVARMRMLNQIRHATTLVHPWSAPPPKDDLVYAYTKEQVESAIRSLDWSVPLAFDYETNMLKPDSAKARLYCASISDGKKSVAFPVNGETEGLLKGFLRDSVSKVGANIKFEQRWSEAKLGVTPRNVDHDTVVEGHLQDSRKGVAGVKFQAFVRLGRARYSDEAEKFLKTKRKGGNARNRIRFMDPQELLKYCAIDSLVEWRIAEHQRKG